MICVPTPLTSSREPDLTYLERRRRPRSARCSTTGQLVVLESTSYPGTTREQLLPALERSGLSAGTDFHLAFSPERIDPGRTDYTAAHDAEARRRPDRGLHRARPRSSTS